MFTKLAFAATAATAAVATAGATPVLHDAAVQDRTVPHSTVSITAPADYAAAVQGKLDELVKRNKFPGALAAVQDVNGSTSHYTAGVGDRRTKAKVPVNGRVRIASNTKMFTAVAVLQLVGDGKIGLDDRVEQYLPGLIRGKAGDGRKITIRQLLQHTSGLPNYTSTMPDIFKIRYRYQSPHDLLRIALTQKKTFAPGKSWAYSNTGYVVAGLIVEKVTRKPLSSVITRQIIKPLGLRGTYWPAKRDVSIRGAHPQGYAPKKAGGPLHDITRLDPSWGGAAGQLIGTPGDLNRFTRALLDGKLLKPAQLKEMLTTVKAPKFLPGWRYGLGIAEIPLSCGGVAYGHGGDIDGYETRNAATKDGRAAAIAVTRLPADEKAHNNVLATLDTALCTD
ncbi:serine hydrolase domain-containing protein [Nonomuraea sp. NPDC002799]